MLGVNRVADFHEKRDMRSLDVVAAAVGSNDTKDGFTHVPIKFGRKDATDVIKNGANGKKVAKEFDGRVYAGVVTAFLPPTAEGEVDLWQIAFDDGDKEQWEKKEMIKGIMLYKEDPPMDHGETEDESDSECRSGTPRGSGESSDDESSDDEGA